MKTPTLLATLRDTFFQLQTLTASTDFKRVIAYYESEVNQPLIINLHTIYRAQLNLGADDQGVWQSGTHKRLPVFAPVNEQVLLTFCQQHEHMLKPPKSIEVGSKQLVLPYEHCALPIQSLEDALDLYLCTKPVWVDTKRCFYDVG